MDYFLIKQWQWDTKTYIDSSFSFHRKKTDGKDSKWARLGPLASQCNSCSNKERQLNQIIWNLTHQSRYLTYCLSFYSINASNWVFLDSNLDTLVSNTLELHLKKKAMNINLNNFQVTFFLTKLVVNCYSRSSKVGTIVKHVNTDKINKTKLNVKQKRAIS